ncbi:MAG: hypothetical protein ICV80_18350 [Microcoleus sp. T1-bin1]|nr:hypothetical protein [Microcoleus sp. T1-bin1]MBD0339399.1 hypothetical protein [Microcoleus sp. Co-bin12]
MTNSEPTTPQGYFISIVDFYVYLYNLAATDRRGRVPARVRSPHRNYNFSRVAL